MINIRNIGGVSLFLFGTTFLWLTPMYAASGIDAPGVGNPPFDVAIHALACAGVLVLLEVPRLEHWVSGHVAAGR
jgi:hypothetical protein